MSLTTLRNLIAKLVTISPTHDELDRALCLVEIEIDSLHGSRRPTRDELDCWFLENYDSDVEIHAEYIREQLDRLIRDPGPNSPG